MSFDIKPDDPRLKFLNPNLKPIESEPGPANRDPLPEGVVSAPEVEAESVTPQAKAEKHYMSRRAGLWFFTLGPAYELVRIDRDLVKQFSVEEKYEGELLNIESPYPVLEGLQIWGGVIQAVASTCEAKLVLWLLNQLFVRKQQGIWWRLRRETICIPDPVRVSSGGIIGPDDLINVHVFLPFGNRGMTKLRQAGRTWKIWFDTKAVPPEETRPPLFAYTNS